MKNLQGAAFLEASASESNLFDSAGLGAGDACLSADEDDAAAFADELMLQQVPQGAKGSHN